VRTIRPSLINTSKHYSRNSHRGFSCVILDCLWCLRPCGSRGSSETRYRVQEVFAIPPSSTDSPTRSDYSALVSSSGNRCYKGVVQCYGTLSWYCIMVLFHGTQAWYRIRVLIRGTVTRYRYIVQNLGTLPQYCSKERNHGFDAYPDHMTH